jgi:hypothetical protein
MAPTGLCRNVRVPLCKEIIEREVQVCWFFKMRAEKERMTHQQNRQVPFVTCLNRDIVVVPCDKQEFIYIRRDVFLIFNASLMALSTMLVTLCFQNVNCTSFQGMLVVAVN